MKTMDEAARIFDFELDFSGSMHCIPMSTRMKLDSCGVKLSLKQWNRFTRVQRQQLVERPCDSAETRDGYRNQLVSLIETQARDKAEFFPADAGGAEWDDPDRIPARVCAHVQSLGLAPLSLDRWSSLRPVQRFALFKLTRPGHKNDNFIPAMREFGLLA